MVRSGWCWRSGLDLSLSSGQPLILVLPQLAQSHSLRSVSVLVCLCWAHCWSLVSAPQWDELVMGDLFCGDQLKPVSFSSHGEQTHSLWAHHSLSNFFWINISVLWQFHSFLFLFFLKPVHWEVFQGPDCSYTFLSPFWYCRWCCTINGYSNTFCGSSVVCETSAWATPCSHRKGLHQLALRAWK